MEKEGSLLYKMLDDMLALANSVSCLLALSAGMYEEEKVRQTFKARHSTAPYSRARHRTALRCAVEPSLAERVCFFYSSEASF